MAYSQRVGHAGVTAQEGPPCTRTISGYFFAGSKSIGYVSQPCTLPMSVVQCRLTDLPQAGCNPSFRWVICFHSPDFPAHTSGGLSNDCRIKPIVSASREM